MRTLRILATAFLCGVLLASCGRTITAPPCTGATADTAYTLENGFRIYECWRMA